jgi:hypothetical protein
MRQHALADLNEATVALFCSAAPQSYDAAAKTIRSDQRSPMNTMKELRRWRSRS